MCVFKTHGGETKGGIYMCMCVSSLKQKADFDVSTFTPVSHYHYPNPVKVLFSEAGTIFLSKANLEATPR